METLCQGTVTTSDLPSVLSSARIIASSAKSVTISPDGVLAAAKKLRSAVVEENLGQPGVITNYLLEPAGLGEEGLLEWLFLLDTLNYCFWSDEATLFTVQYKGERWTGYRSLVAALARAVENGTPIYEPSYYGSMSLSQLSDILQSETHVPIPLLEQRLESLHEAATVLKDKFDGKVTELVKRSGRSAVKLAHLLATHFPSYRDVGTYNGKTVSFLKRAQIFPADVWNRFEGKGFGEFTDIDNLTMFADYRVPQSLLYFGVLRYSDDLMYKLSKGQHLEAGSAEEMEIRGCSIWAIELIKHKIHELSSSSSSSSAHVNSVSVDFFLWTYAKTYSDLMNHLPIHRTNTIFY